MQSPSHLRSRNDRKRTARGYVLPLIAAFAITATGESTHAQGRTAYLNFETPQVKPIQVARIGGHDWILACNTPDNSLEIYDCETNEFVDRIGVGLEPVSVRWNATTSRAYTANMVGDSVSTIALAVDTQGKLVARLDRTEWVGEEPMDIEFSADGQQCFVTLQTAGAIAWLDAMSLAPFGAGTGKIHLFDDWVTPTRSIKQPRRMVRIGNRLFVLAAMGSRRGDPLGRNHMDLWSVDLSTFAVQFQPGMGTGGLGMVATSAGNLFTVHIEARNENLGELAVKNATYGFVESYLQRVDNPGTTSANIIGRNLNRLPSGNPVTKPEALAHPSDVAIVEDAQGNVTKVYVAAFHSDRVGVLQNVLQDDPDTWSVSRIDIKVAPTSTNTRCGPRGLAFKTANPSRSTDPGARLYVLNRLDNSISVIDPATDTRLSTFSLAHDPTPAYIRQGRPFLYSAELSGNGFVSCASCHPDGRLDGQLWDLGGTVDVDPFLPSFVDGAVEKAVLTLNATGLYPADKGFLVTQSLQGLLNWEVDPTTTNFVTNAPYHWRGDRPSFEAFNGAFESLLGGKKLEEDDMRKYRDMINSIHYPPNPEQQLDRRYSGTIGNPDSEDDGTGALAGMKLYHIADLDVCSHRSCVQCHALPEGSNNRITEVFARPGGDDEDHPLETAALRGLFQKEKALVLDADVLNPGLANAGPGLARTGDALSINRFNIVFSAPGQLGKVEKANMVTQFCRELDWGVGPCVGVALTFDKSMLPTGALTAAFNGFELGANEANNGFVVQVHDASGRRGFVFDPRTGQYENVQTGATTDRTGLQGMLVGTDDRLVLMGTPLGSERRVAHPKGQPSLETGPQPSAIKLEKMRPDTAYRDVPTFVDNWDPNATVDPFVWNAVFLGTSIPVPEPRFLRTIRLFQHGLVTDGPSVGLTGLRHDAPRRFRVSGANIRKGALLLIRIPKRKPPYDDVNDTWPVLVPVYPTNETSADGQPVWESAVEFEPLIYYGMMLGGPAAPGVASAWNNTLPEPPSSGTFEPDTWNLHHVTVINTDSTIGIGGWQPLKLQ
ncbi:MAG: hypothetical protein KDC95_04265 [Planctomycetes bacterium]|nr:hypothetical protein [Planctomycetota bacterium]